MGREIFSLSVEANFYQLRAALKIRFPSCVESDKHFPLYEAFPFYDKRFPLYDKRFPLYDTDDERFPLYNTDLNVYGNSRYTGFYTFSRRNIIGSNTVVA